MERRVRTPVITWAIGIGIGMGLGFDHGEAQIVPVTRIDGPEVTYGRDFSDLRSLRELPDGNVIVVEGALSEVRVLAADGVGDRLVGGRGQGPGEYMGVSAVLPIGPSRFSFLADPVQQRILILDAGGAVVTEEPWPLPMGATPQARDSEGAMYFDEIGAIRTDLSGNVIEGPVPLFRMKPGVAEPEVLATLDVHDLAERWAASPVSRMMRPGPDGIALFNIDRTPFGAQDQWVLLSDGRVAIARVSPYRLEILDVDGSTLEGPEVPYEPIPVTGDDREAFLASLNRGESGGGGMSFSTADGASIPIERSAPATDDFHFPETKPPFGFGSVYARPDAQEVWVQRHTDIEEDRTLIDVFDGQGRLIRQVELSGDRILVGVGVESFYTIRYDDFDVQILERFAG